MLTGCNVRSLEKVCVDLISGAKKQKLRVKVNRQILINICAIIWGASDIFKLVALVKWMLNYTPRWSLVRMLFHYECFVNHFNYILIHISTGSYIMFVLIINYRVQSVCQPTFCVLPHVRHLAVKVPRHGIISRWESTRESSICTHHPKLCVKSHPSTSNQEFKSKSQWLMHKLFIHYINAKTNYDFLINTNFY